MSGVWKWGLERLLSLGSLESKRRDQDVGVDGVLGR